MSGPPDSYAIIDVALLATDLERGDTVRPHLQGRNVSSRTYYVHGCRCGGCTTAATRTNVRSHRKSGRLPARQQRGHLPATLVKLRKAERVRRNADARDLALRALRDRYRDEYEAFLAKFHQEISEERGPLPGDDWYQMTDG